MNSKFLSSYKYQRIEQYKRPQMAFQEHKILNKNLYINTNTSFYRKTFSLLLVVTDLMKITIYPC